MSVDEYQQWLEADAKAANMQLDASRRVAENNQRQVEESIANLAALHELNADKLAAEVLGNPT